MKNMDMDDDREADMEQNDGSDTEPVATIDASSVTAEQLAELKERAAKADEHWDRLLRTTADFDNFKKRAARERQDAIRYANEGLIEKLVPVLDNFEMAMAAADASSADSVRSLRDGVAMIHQQLKSALADAGLEEISAAGQAFDPNWHEADLFETRSEEH